jgi:hypothetical protein
MFLTEVMSFATGDSLGNYTKATTIRSKRQVNASIYEQLRGTPCWIKTFCHGFNGIRENMTTS